MLTNITAHTNVTVTAGAVLTGASSGATGIVYADVTTGTDIQLMQTVGTFGTGATELISSSKAGDSLNSAYVSAVTAKQFDRDVKQIYMAQTAGAGKDYTADTALDLSLIHI